MAVYDRHRAVFLELEVRRGLPEERQVGVPVLQDLARPRAPGQLVVTPDERLEDLDVGGRSHLRQADQLRIELLWEIAALVEHVGNAVRHAGAKVASRLTEDDYHALGHVLAAVVAHAFDDGQRAAVAHREALAGSPGHEELAARRAVQHGVADDGVLVACETASRGGRTTTSPPPIPLAT